MLFIVINAYAGHLYLLGDDGERKGCITCNEFHSDSLWNEFSTYGNDYSSESIWNEYGTYGNEYNSVSPWNEYGTGMKIIDLNGNYYGQFTTNTMANQTDFPLLESILEAYSKGKWKSIESFRDWVAPQIP